MLCLLSAASALASLGFLKVNVIDGDGAFNDIKNKVGHPPAVEVRDESNQLVTGAQVVFTLPALGASGTFEGGQKSMTATTDGRGIATAGTFRPNPTEGRFAIAIAASYMGKQGAAVVGQSNTLAASGSSSHKKLWIILAIVGGGAAGGILATHSSSSSSTPAATSISVGTIVVGAPR